MESLPLVSIIIPTFNRAHLINETLDSIIAQTYTNWECIVVDDGSTDNTDEILAEYIQKDSRFKYFHRPEEHLPGGNGARNYGFKMSSGKYVNWFDSDDIMHYEKLNTQVKLLLNSEKKFCVCQTLIFENNIENIIGLRKDNIVSTDPLNDFVQSKIKWLTQSPILKKSFLIENNLLFYEPLKRAQEFEYFVRVLSIEPNYCAIEKPLVFLRKHDDRISSKKYDADKNFSIFLSSEKIYIENSNILNVASKNKLLNSMLSSIFRALNKNDLKHSKILMSKFRNVKKHSVLKLILIKVCEISYFAFGRGYIFYNTLKYA